MHLDPSGHDLKSAKSGQFSVRGLFFCAATGLRDLCKGRTSLALVRYTEISNLYTTFSNGSRHALKFDFLNNTVSTNPRILPKCRIGHLWTMANMAIVNISGIATRLTARYCGLQNGMRHRKVWAACWAVTAGRGRAVQKRITGRMFDLSAARCVAWRNLRN